MAVSEEERQEAIQHASKGWDELQAIIASLTAADLERPDTVGFWSGRDVIAHIGNWEEHGIWLLEQWESGRERLYTYEFDQTDMALWDAWNEKQVSPYRELALGEVFAYADRTHARLMAVAATSPEIDEPTLRGFTWGHYEAHYNDLRQLTSQPAGDR